MLCTLCLAESQAAWVCLRTLLGSATGFEILKSLQCDAWSADLIAMPIKIGARDNRV